MYFLRDSLPFPEDLGTALGKALWPEGEPRLLEQRKAALRRLWPRLAKDRGQAQASETHYSFRRDEADAYAAYYLPANCLKVALILEESFLLNQDPLSGKDMSWLDFGTGPGTAYWGLAWWCARRGKKMRFTGWDQSPVFQALAKDLVANGPYHLQSNFLAGKGDPLELVKKQRPTHVSFVNSLAEIFPDPARRLEELAKILRELRALKNADGQERYLVIIEPGSRESSRELAELKDKLQAVRLGRVLFPCLDARPCGALADPRDWCHEEASCEFPSWLNELGAGAGLRKESMIFSYALIQACDPSEIGTGLRMVSQRMERKGQVECRLCTASGKRPARVQRSKAHANNEFFLSSVRGDIWKNAVLGEKNDVESVEPMIVSPVRSIFGSND